MHKGYWVILHCQPPVTCRWDTLGTGDQIHEAPHVTATQQPSYYLRFLRSVYSYGDHIKNEKHNKTVTVLQGLVTYAFTPDPSRPDTFQGILRPKRPDHHQHLQWVGYVSPTAPHCSEHLSKGHGSS